MTDTQKNAAVVQAAERLFDFASEQIPQPTPKAAQDFTDPENYWHRAALAALPQPAPVTGGEDAVTSIKRDTGVACLASLRAAISLLERGGRRAAPSDKMFEQMLRDYRKAADDYAAALSPSAPEAPSERESHGG